MRIFNPILLNDSDLHQKLMKDGFFITELFTGKEIELLNEGYQDFLSYTDRSRFSHFAASCAVPEIKAKSVAREHLDRVCRKAFKRLFREEAADLVGGTYLIKTCGEGTRPNGLHQDLPMIDETSTFAMYSWTPITETGQNTGKLFVVPGSHLHGIRQRTGPELFDLSESDLLELGFSVETLDIPMGHTVFFDTALMHGSLPNTSVKDRVTVNYYVKSKQADYLYFVRNAENPLDVDVYEIDRDHYYFNQLDPIGTDPNFRFLRYLRTERQLSAPLGPTDAPR